MAELSVIVPIYNVEKYLSRCLDSILQQTYTDFELILVNDGSPDNCAEIIEQYAKKDGRIITIHQENKGVSAARNAGLRIASGKYIGFVDPDDWISIDMYEKLVHTIKRTGTDIVCCNWTDHYPNGNKVTHVVKNMDCLMSYDEFVYQIFAKPRTILGSSCNKIFIKEKIHNYYDENIKIGEDTLFLVMYSLEVSTAFFLNENLYQVFARENSAIRDNPARLVEGLAAIEKAIEILKNNEKNVIKYAEEDYLDACYRMCNMLKSTNETEYYYEARKRLETYIKKNFWRVFQNNEIYWKTKLIYFIKVFLERDHSVYHRLND